MGRKLVTNECQGKCAWEATDERIDELKVFRCTACRSEWTTAESWTPRNWDGDVAPQVAAARRAAG